MGDWISAPGWLLLLGVVVTLLATAAKIVKYIAESRKVWFESQRIRHELVVAATNQPQPDTAKLISKGELVVVGLLLSFDSALFWLLAIYNPVPRFQAAMLCLVVANALFLIMMWTQKVLLEILYRTFSVFVKGIRTTEDIVDVLGRMADNRNTSSTDSRDQ